MKNVSCEIIQDILPLYHDHVCSAASSAMVEEHLKDCAACTRVLAEMDDDKIEADLLSETHEILKRHEKKERSIAFKTGIVIAGILILPVIIVLMLTLPGYSDFKTDAVLIASMLLVAGLTVVPLVSTKKKLSKTIIFSTIALLLVIFFTEMFFDNGGILRFAEIAFSTVFGLSLPLFPIVAYQADLPETFQNHKGLLCMIWDTVWFYLMIFAFCIDYPNAIHDLLVVSSFYVAAAWLIFLAIRYLPCNGFAKAGILIAVCGVSLGIGNQMGWVQLMDRDLHMQMEVGAVLIGLVFLFVGMVLHLKKKSQ